VVAAIAVVAYLFVPILSHEASPRQTATPTPSGPLAVDASGNGPWVISGYGYTFDVTQVDHTRTTPWMGQPAPSLTVYGYVTRTDPNAREVSWDLRDENSNRLDSPVGPVARIVWEQMPTLDQRLPFTLVVYDSNRAKSLTLTVEIYYFPDNQALILRDVPVPQ
jgi:hypothetical protein